MLPAATGPLVSTGVALGRRAVRNAFRRPQLLAPILLFPSLLLAVNVGGLSRTTSLPGFPHVQSFLDFQLAAAITQSILLGAVSSGIATALDLEGGFFDRLLAAPIPRASILIGRLAASMALALLSAVYFLLLGLAFGAEISGGIPGAAVVIAIAVVAGMGFGAIGAGLAFHAGNAATVQGIFPLVFVILFLSSAFFPQNLLEPPADWVAAFNPLSYIAEGMREPIVKGLDGPATLKGLASAAGVTLVAIVYAMHALRHRVKAG